MYTLYWEYYAGSIVVQAALEEIGAPYDTIKVDMANHAHHGPAHRALCPAATVPVLGLPDGQALGETSAILHLLHDRYPDVRLLPGHNAKDRPAGLYWLAYLATAGYPAIARAWHPYRFAETDNAREEVCSKAWADLLTLFRTVEGGIRGEPWVLASGHSVVDTYLAMLVEWMENRDALFDAVPGIARLYAAEAERPGYAKTMAAHTPPPITKKVS